VTIEDFNTELKTCSTVELKSRFIEKNLVHGIPFVFNGSEGDYYNFREKISGKYSVNINDIFVVGSGKLGFSYEKNTDFSLESDVDVVIVNEDLYENYQQAICDYQYQIDRLKKSITVGELEQYNKFLAYFIKGWMRPDLLPTSFDIEILRDDWFQYFRTLSNGKSEVGNYKVSAGLFKNLEYFKKYHLQSITRLYQKITLEDG
jgi:site-specific DNA-adenine methylase